MADTDTPNDDVFAVALAEVEKEAQAQGATTGVDAPVEEEQVVETPEKPVEIEEKESSPPERPRGPDGKFLPKEEKVETPVEEEEEEPLGLSAEQLALIEKDPSLRAVYKSMQRGFTKKTQGLADRRKQLEERARVADWIQSDPDRALETLAQMRGRKFAEVASPEEKTAVAEATDALEKEWTEKVGPEAAKILRPLIEDTAKHIAQTLLTQEVAPLREQAASLSKAAVERSIASAVAEFKAKVTGEGGEWDDDTQKEMAKLISRIEPAEGVAIDEYLDTLYKNVAYERGRKTAAKEHYRRLKTAETETEPTTTIRPAKETPSRISTDMSDDDAIDLAVSLALKDQQGR